MTPTIQKIIIAVVVLILGFFAYEMFFVTPKAPTGNSDASATTTEIVGQDILTLVEKLRSISIDQSVFSSALFNSLTDSEAILVPESTGRSNPFGTIGAENVSKPAGGATIAPTVKTTQTPTSLGLPVAPKNQ